MHGRQAIVRQQFGEHAARIALNHASVGQFSLRQAACRESGIAGGQFDAEKIVLRMSGSRAGEKQPLSATRLDFQRRLALEDRARIPRARKRVERQKMAREIEGWIKFAKSATAHEEGARG